MFKPIVYLLLISISPFLLASSVLAIEGSPANTLDRVLKDHNYIQVGETTFSILFWDLYKSKLQTTSGKYPIESENDKLIYMINYLADISGKDLIERTVEQWQHLKINPEKYQAYIPVLEKIWPDIEEGDTLSLHVNNNKSFFYFNNELVGEVEDQEFSQLFLDIWLSEKTSEPELRLELLGINNNE
tara:strand:+ start:44 stop:604 length:561 start_codon:yes stop_codon:yes gene_type:complete